MTHSCSKSGAARGDLLFEHKATLEMLDASTGLGQLKMKTTAAPGSTVAKTWIWQSYVFSIWAETYLA